MRAPFASVSDPAVRRSAELVFERLWADNRSLVHGDVNTALSDADADLDATRQLLTARWQLEIFLVRGARPAGGAPPARRRPGALSRPGHSRRRRPRVGVGEHRRVMAAYEGAPRRAADLWGSRKTTALGVRVARNLSRSLVPGSGVGAVRLRTLAAVPIMIATAALLARGAFLVACSLLLNVVLVPRLAPGSLFQWVVLGLSTRGVARCSGRCWCAGDRSGAGGGAGWPSASPSPSRPSGGRTCCRPGCRSGSRRPNRCRRPAPWVESVALGDAAVRRHRGGSGHRPGLVPAADLGQEGLGDQPRPPSSVPSGAGGSSSAAGSPPAAWGSPPSCRPPWARCGSRPLRSSSSRPV